MQTFRKWSYMPTPPPWIFCLGDRQICGWLVMSACAQKGKVVQFPLSATQYFFCIFKDKEERGVIICHSKGHIDDPKEHQVWTLQSEGMLIWGKPQRKRTKLSHSLKVASHVLGQPCRLVLANFVPFLFHIFPFSLSTALNSLPLEMHRCSMDWRNQARTMSLDPAAISNTH